MDETKDTDSWKRLLEILQNDPELRAEASAAMEGYSNALHEMGHDFMDHASEHEVDCTRMTHFLLGILRLGYLRARVGSTEDDEVPEIEKGCREGDRIMGSEELKRLLKGIDL